MVDWLFAICLALGGQIAAKLVTLAMGVVAVLAVFALGRALFNARVGLWAAALFYTTPMTAWLSGTTYTDLAAALFPLAAMIAFLRWREEREDGWLWICGFLAGATVGVKITAAYGLPVIGIAVLWDLARRREVAGRARLRSLLVLVAAVCLTALPWYLLRYVLTGNPFFPLLNGLFPGARALPADFDPGAMVGEGLGKGSSLWETWKLPFLLTFRTNDFGEPFPAGALGAALAILFPLGLFLLVRRRSAVTIVLAACAADLLLWDIFRGVRHYFAVLPLVIALAVGTVDALSPPGWRRRLHFALLGAILLAQVPEIPLQYWNIPDRVPMRLALGHETRDHFLTRALPAYAAVQYINAVARPGESVLGVAAANLRFYLKPRLDTLGENWEVQRLSRARGARLASNLATMGCVYLLLPDQHIKREADAAYPFLEVSFLDRFAILEFRRNGWRVYRLKSVD
jgi:hypothetical protein